ncbi:MAG: hypothetical protein K1000chlam3_01114 [Chlamydiae bacterium]|nr:hypothetical protein [Chlamydiota bacterium]
MTVIINAKLPVGLFPTMGFGTQSASNDETSSKVTGVMEKGLEKLSSGLSKALEGKGPIKDSIKELMQNAAILDQSIIELKQKVEQNELDESFTDSSYSDSSYSDSSFSDSSFSDSSFSESYLSGSSFEEFLHKKLEELESAKSSTPMKSFPPEIQGSSEHFGFFPEDGDAFLDIK